MDKYIKCFCCQGFGYMKDETVCQECKGLGKIKNSKVKTKRLK